MPLHATMITQFNCVMVTKLHYGNGIMLNSSMVTGEVSIISFMKMWTDHIPPTMWHSCRGLKENLAFNIYSIYKAFNSTIDSSQALYNKI